MPILLNTLDVVEKDNTVYSFKYSAIFNGEDYIPNWDKPLLLNNLMRHGYKVREVSSADKLVRLESDKLIDKADLVILTRKAGGKLYGFDLTPEE